MSEANLHNWLFSGGILAVGAGIQWVVSLILGRKDKRMAEIEAREDALEKREADQVKKLGERVAGLEAIVEHQGQEIGRLTLALNILIAKEIRTDPNSSELRQVNEILTNGKIAIA